ncbi:hypothetical protein BDM02DRAFT_1830212 [Thelephora ganbajun]|uniref:Uncharacterized protein n=1 Tax=Thelephora ganbajun TaxID=370292 RepID=A0ACB6ZIU5_THEGA|nr:hypothetical protein BDM02DRAFT_1830212 [Thelephora ganbajun]
MKRPTGDESFLMATIWDCRIYFLYRKAFVECEAKPGPRSSPSKAPGKLIWSESSNLTVKPNASADALGPLRSAAGGICFTLRNCERTKANKQSIESLAPRVKVLSESLCTPFPRAISGISRAWGSCHRTP